MDYTISAEVLPAQPALVARTTCRQEEIGAFLGDAFGRVIQAIADAGATPAGPPFARYDMEGGRFRVQAGFPTSVNVAVKPATDLEATELPGGETAVTMHVGAYQDVGAAYAAIEAWLAGTGRRPSGAPWEAYLDGPEVAMPRTQVFWPCANA